MVVNWLEYVEMSCNGCNGCNVVKLMTAFIDNRLNFSALPG
jgi:hypothetical protein